MSVDLTDARKLVTPSATEAMDASSDCTAAEQKSGKGVEVWGGGWDLWSRPQNLHFEEKSPTNLGEDPNMYEPVVRLTERARY